MPSVSDASLPLEWRFYVEDMVDFCAKVSRYAQGLDRSSVVALRDQLIHGYLGVDDDTLWSIVRDDLAPLREALTRLLAARP